MAESCLSPVPVEGEHAHGTRNILMFRRLILSALAAGPKTTPDLYDLARLRQPDDCKGPLCAHRNSPSDMEWQHELRREQQRLKREGMIELRDGRWELRITN